MTVRDSCFDEALSPDAAESFLRHLSWPISSGYRSPITSRRCYQAATGRSAPHGRSRCSSLSSVLGIRRQPPRPISPRPRAGEPPDD